MLSFISNGGVLSQQQIFVRRVVAAFFRQLPRN
jgi:hypothetical protein